MNRKVLAALGVGAVVVLGVAVYMLMKDDTAMMGEKMMDDKASMEAKAAELVIVSGDRVLGRSVVRDPEKRLSQSLHGKVSSG